MRIKAEIGEKKTFVMWQKLLQEDICYQKKKGWNFPRIIQFGWNLTKLRTLMGRTEKESKEDNQSSWKKIKNAQIYMYISINSI